MLLEKFPEWLAVFSKSEIACLPVSVGNACMMSASAPAAVGAENEVPETAVHSPVEGLQLTTMPSPGATTKPARASRPPASAWAENEEMETLARLLQLAAVCWAVGRLQLTDPTASTE